MLGRAGVMARLKRHLLRESPLHVSLIGPAQMGKSTVLRAIASDIRESGERFEAVVYWNLSHGTPRDDDEFLAQLHERVKQAAVARDPEWELWFEADSTTEALEQFFDEVKSQGKALLIVLDSLDAPLSKGSLARKSLDWLRSLSDGGSAVFVTGSRATLLELCKSEETESSPFWNIFYDPPEELGPWEAHEWDEILAPFSAAGIKVHPATRTALQSWTNGVPSLATLVLAALFDTPAEDGIHERHVEALCEALVTSEAQILKQLWQDCHPDWQADLVELGEGRLPLGKLPAASLKALRKRGFVRKEGTEATACCRLMSEFARQTGSQVEHLSRLFSEQADYRRHIASVLGKRLAQIEGGDEKLLKFIRHALAGLASDPETCVQGIRGIADRALNLAFSMECPNGQIDQSWLSAWQHANQGLARSQEVSARQVPRSPHLRRELLLVMTGDMKSARVAQYVSKPTALLVDFIQSAGDFGQHLEDNEVTFEFAVTVCAAAIELCEHLARELP